MTSLYRRELEDGRVLIVTPMIYTTRLCIGDDLGYDKGWCYETAADAIAAAAEWDGSNDDPPGGWHREIGAPWRRRPSGDREREFCAP